MSYYPKSKYKISQTSGREFMYLYNQKEYTGDYIITSDGTLYAGNNSTNINFNKVIIPIQESKKDGTYIVMEDHKIGTSTEYFNSVNKKVYKEQDDFKPIISTKPSPTDKDYLKGYFYRYVAKRKNSNTLYYEIDKKTYESITNKESRYDDYLHHVEKLRWSLTDGSDKTNHLTMRQIQKNTRMKKLLRFFTNFSEYQLSIEILDPRTTPENVNSPKPKLPKQNRKSVTEAQETAIDIIKEKARKRNNRTDYPSPSLKGTLGPSSTS